MKKHILLVSMAAFALLSCGSNDQTTSTENPTEQAVDNDWTWGNITKESISGRWQVESLESDVYDAKKIVGKEFHFNGDSLELSYFLMNDNVETKTCFYEFTAENSVKVTVPMENGDKWIEFEGAIDGKGILRLDHKGNMLLLKKAN